ncbi:chromophore lyase CpcT/CpeT [Tolypothrix sp. FACHB-123]|uniref:chromophore lyase CpcT/CpeT n=1 Tax=Tolypothrix sp. FACHB-123 TaxID=2692868 RepID=UPI0016854E2F|nr:chromophore lyase CpcT/CpeT [Tolypothrix sp. FACHB-123]MBD2355657.1 chromophore lyase CpcT/CpeT [Tolypothrix sp. FACHB-123]
MSLSSQLTVLGQYLAGEFDNQEQAINDPVWYVHLRLWQRPVNLFSADSITLFAEQANIINLENPYRQRIMRLQSGGDNDAPLQVQYYMPKDPNSLKGAGRNPNLLDTLTPDSLDLLPGCVLTVTPETIAPNCYKFVATPLPNTSCCFTYLGNTIQVSLGFAASTTEFLSYDKGIDSTTGKATWGAVLGPYRYTKRQHY